jgi:hypothetical protein
MRRLVPVNTQTGGPSITAIFSDNIFYCPKPATCFGFYRKSSSGTGLKYKTNIIKRRGGSR